MKVKMISTATGPGSIQLSGKEYDLDEKYARDLVAGKFATWVGEPPADPVPVANVEKKKVVVAKETADKPVVKETADKPI